MPFAHSTSHISHAASRVVRMLQTTRCTVWAPPSLPWELFVHHLNNHISIELFLKIEVGFSCGARNSNSLDHKSSASRPQYFHPCPPRPSAFPASSFAFTAPATSRLGVSVPHTQWSGACRCIMRCSRALFQLPSAPKRRSKLEGSYEKWVVTPRPTDLEMCWSSPYTRSDSPCARLLGRRQRQNAMYKVLGFLSMMGRYIWGAEG